MLWIVVGWTVHIAGNILLAYAGQKTITDLSVRILASVNVVFALSLTLSGLSITLYFRERHLHRRTRKRLTERITELELKIDPSRTSSLLTPEGLTRREDEV